MATINLSFKEWPYLITNQANQKYISIPKPPSSPAPQGNRVEVLKSNSSFVLVSMNNISNKILLQKTAEMLSDEEDISDIKLPIDNFQNKTQSSQLSSWGRCGLFACTYGSCLAIYANDDNECLTPIFMFSPFEKFTVGKIQKQPPNNTLITAIGWSNGYLQPSISKPYLAVASEKGHLLIYDINAREMIGNFRFNETIVSILWSSLKLNRFYVGTKTGHLYICELNKKKVQIQSKIEFSAYSKKFAKMASKPVDFIAQDDVNGKTLAIASKDGFVGYVTNIDDPQRAELHVFQYLPFKSIFKENKKAQISIYFFQFYPNDQDFVIIGTNTSTFLISLSRGILIPFIPDPNYKFISILDDEKDKVVVGDDNELTVWNLVNQSWVRSSVLKIGEKFGHTEILTFSKNNQKIVLTTASNWLTEVEYRRNKLFVSKRIKLVDGAPIDYDFGYGSIAMLTDNNSISFTQFTPESVIKTKFADDKQPTESSDDSSQSFPIFDDSNNEYIENPDIKKIGSNRSIGKSSSMTFGPDTSKGFQHIVNHGRKRARKTSDADIPLVLSDSDLISQNAVIKFNENDLQCGNSNTLSLTFNIKVDDEKNKIKNIQWISSHKLVAWSKNSFNLIDLKAREVTQPFVKKFNWKCNTISQVFFSKSRKIMVLVLNHKEVYLMNTEFNFEVIKSVDFTKFIKKDCDKLFGCVSPYEDKAVFVSQNLLFFVSLNDKDPIKRIHSSLEFDSSFILWKKRGIFIGTEKGSVFLITKKKLTEICKVCEMNNRDVKVIYDSLRPNKKQLGSIKMIVTCSNNSLIVLDSNDQGILCSSGIKTIADNIKAFKQCSKDTFLVRLQNYDKLIAINAFDDFSPSLPPFNFNEFELNEDSIESIKNQLIVNNKSDPSLSLRNTVHLLNKVLSLHDIFISTSSKTFLKLGDLEKARNLLLNTDPNDEEYMNNMMVAALYDQDKYLNKSDSVDLVVKNFLSNNLTDLAVNIMLIVGNNYSAARILFNLGRNIDAYNVLMLTEYKVANSDSISLAKGIANSLIRQKENVIFGLKLLATYGCIEELAEQLLLNLQVK
ncbi:hypothetical protein M9Y10_032413 [Tritrichomonas musculus]|uniref:Uncharacterized protein n=1 Tax=Tritrichomonas musculus TaxID=1915356 RepID=A0ABR2GZ73_9EUKA